MFWRRNKSVHCLRSKSHIAYNATLSCPCLCKARGAGHPPKTNKQTNKKNKKTGKQLTRTSEGFLETRHILIMFEVSFEKQPQGWGTVQKTQEQGEVLILSRICDDCLYCRVILKYLMSCTIRQPQHVEGLDREDKAVSQSADANLEIILALAAAATAARAPTTATICAASWK